MSFESQFTPILTKCLRKGEDYRERPPKGPPSDYPALSQQDLDALSLTEHGEDTSKRGKVYSSIEVVEMPPQPVDVSVPSADDLADTHVCGIDGSNQRVERGSFHFILCRAAMVAFRYSGTGQRPYFYRLQKDATAIVWVDGNIFENQIAINTFPQESDEKDIIPQLKKNIEKPLMYRYQAQENKPGSYALGVAVKIMQGLELLCIEETPLHAGKVVCIKDGPLFSTSATPRDVQVGLAPLFKREWDENCTYVACSKRVRDSTLLLEALLSDIFGTTLRNHWFPGQNIVNRTLEELPSDSLLLPKVLKPGQRTPLIAATPVARNPIVKEDKRLEPLSCYYLSRTRPHTYMRLEIPRFMWERSRDSVEYAIKITAWQHELGRTAPLVLNMADEQCDISNERRILEWRTDAALQSKRLDLLQDYHE